MEGPNYTDPDPHLLLANKWGGRDQVYKGVLFSILLMGEKMPKLGCPLCRTGGGQRNKKFVNELLNSLNLHRTSISKDKIRDYLFSINMSMIVIKLSFLK